MRGPCVLFGLTVGVDTAISIALATNMIPFGSAATFIGTGCYMIAQLVASLYFFYGAWSVKAVFRGVAQPPG